ncbi:MULTISPECIES: cytochrome c maturation protein CcmE [unclassified Janthinobacterium]|uniref:cytochrome c maturation protein CcmE n=1 Tax=unclassified Janthinobacterium TaxID=2610881 RepID=UPI000B81B4C9|nr:MULTISPECIES: cytochrome c maturation protein CcmE [unclassified Janthinobacterium]
MKPQMRRALFLVAGASILLGAAAYAVSVAQKNMIFFYTPSQVVEGCSPHHKIFRIGGIVAPGSLKYGADGMSIMFTISDNYHTVAVQYSGMVPDMFAEGKGVVAQGKLLNRGIFMAQEVLAKHDENYMSPEIARAAQRGSTVNSAISLPMGCK